jgi:cytochrome c-type biogenesis protein CcmH
VQALEEKIRKDPNDLQARNDLAKAYFDSENLMAVFDQTQYVLDRAPNDARALTYQALVRTAMGQMDRARDMLQSATKSDPQFLDAWVSLAWVQMQMGREDESRKAIDEGMRRHPEERARLEQLFGQMRQRAAQSQGVAPPTPAAQSPQPAQGPSIAITLNSSKPAPPNAVIFVLARAEGVTAGPPIAVKRIPATAFPISVQLSAADSMMGQELPPRVRIEARVDSDGVATTKTADDISASQDGVAVGSSVSLTLR